MSRQTRHQAYEKAVRGHLAKRKKRRPKKFIQGAIKRPGALTSAVGGKPSQHMGAVRRLAASGTTLQKRQANFYLHVLRRANRKRG